MKVEDLCKRRKRLQERDHNFMGVWQELGQFFMPRKSRIFNMGNAGAGTSVNKQPEGTSGLKLTSKLFDSSPMQASLLLASNLHGALTSEAFKWFKLKTRRQDLNDIKAVAEYLDEVADRIYLAISQSNFSAEMQEVYQDVVIFGTGAILILEKNTASRVFSGLRFQAQPIGGYSISEDGDGFVNTIFTDIFMSINAAFAIWGDAIGEKLLEKKEKDGDKLIAITHFVGPRTEEEYASEIRGRKQKPWASCYFWAEGKHLISEGGFDSFPYAVVRWAKAAAEVWGRGPGWVALPDAKTLNQAVYMTLKAWAKGIDPPMMSKHNGVIGTIKLHAGGVTTVRDMDGIKPMPQGTNFEMNQVQSDHIRAAIRDVFFNNQLQLPNGPQMTATEVERRIELMQRFLGPTLGRIQSELLAKIIGRAFHIMELRGALPAPPPELAQAGSIDIEYQGPLARAQRQTDVQSIERTIQALLPLGEIDPTVYDVLDVDVIAKIIADRNEAPPQILRSPEALAQKRQLRQQQQQLQMAAQAGKAAPLLKAISPKGLPGMSPDQAAA